MATSQIIYNQIPIQLDHRCTTFRRPLIAKAKPITTIFNPSDINKFDRFVPLSFLQELSSKSTTTTDMKQLVEFLYQDLPHVFDDQGIDRTAYDERVQFRDPITKHDSISGYLLNISMLKKLFNPDFQLHWVKQTGTYEITTRWTVVMRFILLPWNPELVLTGTSVMRVNPNTNKFCSLTEYWDSIDNNNYFSQEGLMDVLKQLMYYKIPESETPKYQILKRHAVYEVRKYDSYYVVETEDVDRLSAGSSGYNAVAGLPKQNQEGIGLRIAAVMKFSGKLTEDVVQEKEKALRASLIKDGHKPKLGCLFARYNNPGWTWGLIMRNRLLIWLEYFSLD